jgi:hypothetical protein
MATRYGGKGLRRFGLAHAILAALAITAVIGFATFQFVQTRNENVGQAKAWDIKGPPCPMLTQAEWTAKHWEAKKLLDYGGIRFGRAAGDADCAEIKQSGGFGLFSDLVCQFTSPAALTVTSKAGTWFFVPGVGQPSTLIIHKDVPRCVMASNFTLQNE